MGIATIVLAWLLAATSVAALTHHASAQEGATSGPISLHVGEGRLLRLDRAAINVLVGDTSVADVQIVSPSTLYV